MAKAEMKASPCSIACEWPLEGALMGLELKVLRVMLKLLAIRYREKSRGKNGLARHGFA